jgi:hypothetical protein
MVAGVVTPGNSNVAVNRTYCISITGLAAPARPAKSNIPTIALAIVYEEPAIYEKISAQLPQVRY